MKNNISGYLYDLVWKKKYPLNGGIRRKRPESRKNGRRILHQWKQDTPVIGIGMKEKEYKKLRAENWGQPFELYWNYNIIRQDPAYQAMHMRRFNRRPMLLPKDRAEVKRYIKFPGTGFGRELTSKKTGKKFMWWTLDVKELSKFEVFKAASEAKYKKKHMS